MSDNYYEFHWFFCTNKRTDGRQCCEDINAQAMRDYAKKRCKELGLTGNGQVRVNNAGCLDRCAEGPVCVIYPEGTWYTWVDEADIDEIIAEHLLNHRIVTRLKI